MKRTYRRRSDEQMIEDLEAKVREVQQRVESRQRKDSPVLKEIPKLKRKLAGFAQLCMDHNRKDLSNTVLAFLTTIEVQAKQRTRDLLSVWLSWPRGFGAPILTKRGPETSGKKV